MGSVPMTIESQPPAGGLARPAVPAVEVAVGGNGGLKRAVKRGVQGIFALLTIPRICSYWIARSVVGSRAFGAASESIARIPGMRGVFARQAFYRRTLSHCGRDVSFGWMSVFSMTEARVADRVYIGRFCSLGYADLGEEVMLADGVQILSGGREHTREDVAASMQSQKQWYQRVKVGRGTWIGAGAVVMADVGNYCIIGAGAVVNKPIPDCSLAVGVPARVVKKLPCPEDSSSVAAGNSSC
jgi:acetyltransferase-like isoleucine patch superfamily enzyme